MVRVIQTPIPVMQLVRRRPPAKRRVLRFVALIALALLAGGGTSIGARELGYDLPNVRETAVGRALGLSAQEEPQTLKRSLRVSAVRAAEPSVPPSKSTAPAKSRSVRGPDARFPTAPVLGSAARLPGRARAKTAIAPPSNNAEAARDSDYRAYLSALRPSDAERSTGAPNN
jgi:hypothetical protein